ncbi:LacI family DNA-binding transcriptional regulator [Caldifermentibacillus hisashii]|uniref:LacI family DNA-binding transcriptional regulator n=1 Tax=Caldifermentibacillus hisashii TaxID=996558 RepID=UPI000BA4C759|nr:LacI family DNA-binding transcriptional regulator [Caldifermentibacillus hisashii]PAC35336.1 LacI family transcriptional regulator [Caldifermentibacillus hisashii]
MKIKLEDVAELAGVSPTTVSRVLNDRGYISEKTRNKVMEAIKELNYYPNDIARSLFKQRTNFIGLILPTINNPFYSELALYIENISSTFGFKIILCNSLGQMEKEKSYAEMLIRHQVDGMIVCSYNRGIDAYKYPKLPIVAIDHYLSPTIPVVGSDNYVGGRLAVQHLINKGCKSIIHINGPIDLETPTQQRRKAYEDLIENPITYELKDLFNEETTTATIRRIFEEHPETDGIFASDDLIAATCLKVAKELNIDVPQDLRIVGYDGSQTVLSLLPQLTTIRQPIEDIAKTAVLKLIDLINDTDEEGTMEIVLPVQLLTNGTA